MSGLGNTCYLNSVLQALRQCTHHLSVIYVHILQKRSLRRRRLVLQFTCLPPSLPSLFPPFSLPLSQFIWTFFCHAMLTSKPQSRRRHGSKGNGFTQSLESQSRLQQDRQHEQQHETWDDAAAGAGAGAGGGFGAPVSAAAAVKKRKREKKQSAVTDELSALYSEMLVRCCNGGFYFVIN